MSSAVLIGMLAAGHPGADERRCPRLTPELRRWQPACGQGTCPRVQRPCAHVHHGARDAKDTAAQQMSVCCTLKAGRVHAQQSLYRE